MITTILSGEQIKRINDASLEVLERCGVIVPHRDILGLFADAGAHVVSDRQQVKIPPDLVTNLVGMAGRSFTLCGRDVSCKAEFGAGKRNYNSIAGEAHWVDEAGGKRRYATLKDVAVASRFADGLSSINIAGAMADPHELPVSWRSVAVVAEMIRNTVKPVGFWFHDRASASYIMEILTSLRGDEVKAKKYPLFYPFLEPISPLRFPFNGVDLLFETSRLDLPVSIGPMAQTGLSAPGTLAGTMVQENAEILAGICITQLIKPGIPVCYGGICHAFDMSTTQMIFAGPEQAIYGVAMTQMGKNYGLPVYINVGLTDSKIPDGQAGMEAGITLALGASAGADIFGHMGISGVDQASSLDMLAMQNEIIAYVEKVLYNLEVNDETLGVNEILEAGPGGTFIDREHTVRHFRKELWFPRLLDRNYYQQWYDGGGLDMRERCRLEKERILNTHRAEPLSPELSREIEKIVASARKSLEK